MHLSPNPSPKRAADPPRVEDPVDGGAVEAPRVSEGRAGPSQSGGGPADGGGRDKIFKHFFYQF